ncbi:hypothetical protein [Phenylobacterium sp.]|uniref:hypothetical protein n=1 Tax=Phenylobacterium sp. TaxID=1871053 RepID=UPI0035AEED17
MTAEQQALLDRLTAALASEPRVQAAWLSGSLGRGEGDAWSDVDLTVLVAQDDLAQVIAAFRAPRPDMPPVVFGQLVHGRIVSAVTPNWDRYDLAFVTPAELAWLDGAALTPLLGETAPPPARPPPDDRDAARRVEALAAEFLRVLGLAPVAFGRGEWIVALQGLDLLRSMLVDLMLEENGVPPGARGAKRLNPFLTTEQQRLLEALAAPRAERRALLEAQRELATLFLPRARALTEALGAAWPAEFEEATRRRLRAALDLSI